MLDNVKPKLFLCVITIYFDELPHTDVEIGYRTLLYRQQISIFLPSTRITLLTLVVSNTSSFLIQNMMAITWLPDFAYLNYLILNECVCCRNLLFPALNKHLGGIQIENDKKVHEAIISFKYKAARYTNEEAHWSECQLHREIA